MSDQIVVTSDYERYFPGIIQPEIVLALIEGLFSILRNDERKERGRREDVSLPQHNALEAMV